MEYESSVILGGDRFRVEAPVLTWKKHGMTFRAKKRRQEPDLVIWHWTGGENSAETTYHVLVNRGLSVSFCIDRYGIIWQFIDPVLFDPQDTGGQMGKRSISIEVANYGFRAKGQVIPRRGRDRETDEERIHGVKLDVARFYPTQIKSVAELTKTLCENLDIPFVFPRKPSGELLFGEMDVKDRKKYVGIIGHFHKTKKKFDPGFDIFRELEHLEEKH